MKLIQFFRRLKKANVLKPLFFRRVVGTSMEPTLGFDQVVVASSLPTPDKGDIVVAFTGGQEVIKRVARIDDNGFWLEGDNPKASTDSRTYGYINPDAILGVVIYPLRKVSVNYHTEGSGKTQKSQK